MYETRTFQSKAKALDVEYADKCEENSIFYELDHQWIFHRLTRGCELTDIPFDLGDRDSLLYPYIDRIIPNDVNGEYTKDNCRIILKGLDILKGNSTDEKMVKFLYVVNQSLSGANDESSIVDAQTDGQLLKLLNEHFAERQVEIIMKRYDNIRLTKTEKEYYSRTVKKKLVTMADVGIEWVITLLKRL